MPTRTRELTSQDEISAEIDLAQRAARNSDAQPVLAFAPYRSSVLQHPKQPLRRVDPEHVELVAPVFGHSAVSPSDSDLTIQGAAPAIGERIVLTGRIVDGAGAPVRDQLVEIWQANAAGRYVHQRDRHPAPLDPNFVGAGRVLTDADGIYRFTTIKPGPYPWRNHHNAWRPAHVHFSLFGTQFTQRLITQMYFPGDPLCALDPIYQSITDLKARERLVARYDHTITEPGWATGYRWDIVLTGAHATAMERAGDDA